MSCNAVSKKTAVCITRIITTVAYEPSQPQCKFFNECENFKSVLFASPVRLVR